MSIEYKTGYRVGMTTDLVERKKHWEREYSDINGLGLMIEGSWYVFPREYHDRKQAQAAETVLKDLYCADGHHGGANPKENKANIGDLLVSNPLPWRVYVFRYWYKPSVAPKFDVSCLPPDIFTSFPALFQTQEMVEAVQRAAFANSAASLANRRDGRRGVSANSATERLLGDPLCGLSIEDKMAFFSNKPPFSSKE
jgi:hypothetical protein